MGESQQAHKDEVEAVRLGRKVVLIEPGKHLGGMTSGGLGWTDNGSTETIGGLSREFYQRAKDALPPGDRKRLVAAEIMRAVYFETLTRIERSGHDVFTARARVPKPRQALIALRQWLWA